MNRGFSLIEFVVVILISVGLIVASIPLFFYLREKSPIQLTSPNKPQYEIKHESDGHER